MPFRSASPSNIEGRYSPRDRSVPKSGKTTIASKFPGALVLAFEKGYNAIPGIMAKPMNSWNDFKKVLTELRDPEVKEVFQTIVIDTADIAYTYCERYICNRESTATSSYETIGDIPYGKGYKLTMSEFDESIRKILQMDYGLVLISHSTDKTFTDENGNEYNQIVPTLDNRARLVCERTCDIIGFSTQVKLNDGKEQTRLFMRGTTRFVAGSRFKYTPDSIEFSYDNLVKAIADAIDEEAKRTGDKYVTAAKAENLHVEEKHYDFEALMKDFQATVGELMTKDPAVAPKITAIVEDHLGKGRKVNDCTAEQAEQIDLILFDLKKL